MALEKATDHSERTKAAGNTPAQKEMRAYHEGDFQTTDPVTGEKRDQPLPEPVNDQLAAQDDDEDAAAANDGEDADYESMTVEELRAEAGDLDVRRRGGGEGAPVKADYIRALRKRDRA